MIDQGSSPIVRPAVAADAIAIVDLHFVAVHRTASTFYAAEVIDSWSRPPDEARYQQVRQTITGGDELILVAEDSSGVVAFGSIVPRLRELRAVYILTSAPVVSARRSSRLLNAWRWIEASRNSRWTHR